MKQAGFTLIELMITVAILGILAMYAMPNLTTSIVKTQVGEGLGLVEPLQARVMDYYRENGRFPTDNAAAGLPAPDRIIGNYVTGVTVQDGALHIEFGNHVHLGIAGKTLSLRPQVVAGSPGSPPSWQCGRREAPEGMRAVGANRTDVQPYFLPLHCF